MNDVITVGYSTHKKMLDEKQERIDFLEAQVASYIDSESGYTHRIEKLEAQILVRDEKIIEKNKDIRVLNQAFEIACRWLEAFDATEQGCKKEDFMESIFEQAKKEVLDVED